MEHTSPLAQGASEEPRIPLLFPAKPKVITTTGQVSLGAEPVRAKRADVWISGDSDVILLAKRNESWAHVIDPGNPLFVNGGNNTPLFNDGRATGLAIRDAENAHANLV